MRRLLTPKNCYFKGDPNVLGHAEDRQTGKLVRHVIDPDSQSGRPRASNSVSTRPSTLQRTSCKQVVAQSEINVELNDTEELDREEMITYGSNQNSETEVQTVKITSRAQSGEAISSKTKDGRRPRAADKSQKTEAERGEERTKTGKKQFSETRRNT